MKREIKFRAWVTGSNVMVSWEEIYQNDRECLCSLMDYITAPDCVTMQFTGLRDKNGKEIYEGDVINVPYNHIGKQRVEWESHRGRWSVAVYDLTRCSVIGNIYSNPELLNP